MKQSRRRAIYEIRRSEKHILPKTQSTSNIEYVTMFAFNSSILLWSVNTRRLMYYSSFLEISCESKKLCTIIRTHSFDRLGKLIFNESEEFLDGLRYS